MHVYLLRHGLAGERDDQRFPDDTLRPLTGEGKRRTRAVARGMAGLELGIEQIISSPLVRARQTADIAAAELKMAGGSILESAALAPDRSPGEIFKALRDGSCGTNVLLVGHEPHLSSLVSLMVTGRADGMEMAFKKAGLAGIDCEAELAAGSGVLEFLLKPGQLAMMGRAS